MDYTFTLAPEQDAIVQQVVDEFNARGMATETPVSVVRNWVTAIIAGQAARFDEVVRADVVAQVKAATADQLAAVREALTKP